MVKTLCFHCRGHRFDPCPGNWGTKIPQAARRGQKKECLGHSPGPVLLVVSPTDISPAGANVIAGRPRGSYYEKKDSW